MGGADDWLPLSGIQHFCFCRRQWALIHLEQQWAENRRTVEGQLDHARCHDADQTRPNGAAACSSPEGCRWSAVGWA